MKILVNKKTITPDAIFIDLDGTLLDLPKHKMSEENKNAVLQASKESLVVISTGRAYGNTVKHVISALNLEYAICQNGALIVDKKGKIISETLIEKVLVKKIIEFAIKNNLVVLVNSEFRLYNRRALLFLLRLFSAQKYPSFDKFNFEKNIRKIVLAGSFRKKMFKYYGKIKEIIPDLNYSLSGNDYIIEITNQNIDKGIAAQFLCNLLKLDPKKSIHIGDSLNDASSLNYLGALIAMKGASKHLLEIATYTATEKDRNGVASILNGHFKKN